MFLTDKPITKDEAQTDTDKMTRHCSFYVAAMTGIVEEMCECGPGGGAARLLGADGRGGGGASRLAAE